ncbi:MAG: hypothetical protein KJ063_16845 [Anaerolineae bacterium]|nr:hypothetical protein [Anaerolineae bacterium]
MKQARKWVIVAVMAFTLALSAYAFNIAAASSSGRTGFSGNPNTSGGANCNVCHGGGTVPEVMLAGPATVNSGETVTYTLVISGGQEVAGGFNVSAVHGNLLIVPGTTDTQLLSGELTHTGPKAVDGDNLVVFTFRWTAPDYGTQAVLYGAGNSVDQDGSPGGDAAATDVFTVTVLGPTSVSLTSVGGNAAATSLLIWLIPFGGLALILALAAIRYRRQA